MGGLTKRFREFWRTYASAIAFALGVASCIGVVLATVKLSSQAVQNRRPGRTVFDFVAQLPTSGWLYVVVGLIALLVLAAYWFKIEKYRSTICSTDKERSHLFVVGELRRRALALRTRAVVFLVSSVILLLGGVYVTIWVVPLVRSYDINEQVSALLQVKHVGVLDAIRKGNYWLLAGEIDRIGGAAGRAASQTDASDDITLRVHHNEKVEAMNFALVVGDGDVLVSENGLGLRAHDEPLTWLPTASEDDPAPDHSSRQIHPDYGSATFTDDGEHGAVVGGLISVHVEVDKGSWNDYVWRLPMESFIGPRVEVFEFSAEGRYGLIGTRDGTLRMTTDGGKTWATWTRQYIGLNPAEWIVKAGIGSNGAHLLGSEDTVVIWNGENWVTPERMVEQPSIMVFEFSQNGLHGLVGTQDGFVHVTADGGKTWNSWSRESIGFNGAEWAAGAAIDGSGVHLVVGDEGSVRIREGEQWASPKGKVEWRPVTAVKFNPSGLRGLVGTQDGAVHLTADSGKSWLTQTRQYIGLNAGEWVVRAAMGDDGVHLLGDEGSVRSWDGERWAALESMVERSPITAFEFSQSALHGLVGTRDGFVHVTADAGKTWNSWSRESIGLNGAEWAVDAVIGRDGVRFVVGDEGSVRSWDGEEWAAPKGRARWPPVTAVELIGSGQQALLQTGSVVVTKTKDGEWEDGLQVTPRGSIHADRDVLWFLTTEGDAMWTKGGGDWSRIRPRFEDQSIAAIVLDENNRPVVVGTKGATIIGGRYERGSGDLVPEENEEARIVSVAAVAGKVFVLVEAQEGEFFTRSTSEGRFRTWRMTL